MTAFVAGDVTYSFDIKNKVFQGRKGYEVRGTLSFGNDALTVPSDGIPLTKGKLGLPRFVRSLRVLESNMSGYTFEYDVSAEKLLVMKGAAPTISLGNAAANVVANAAIGLSALANAAALQGSGGPWVGITGVQASAQAAFTGAPSAMVLEVVAQGY